MEITYINCLGKEKTLKGWRASLFLLMHKNSLDGGDVEYFFDDVFLHIKGAKFKAKGDLIFSGFYYITFEDCEFSCTEMEISKYDVVQFKNNTFKQNSPVCFSDVNEVELNLTSSENKIEYQYEAKKIFISGNGENAQISGSAKKVTISNASNISINEIDPDDLEIISSKVTLNYCRGNILKLINSKFWGKNVFLPSLILQNSRIESEETLEVDGMEYAKNSEKGIVLEDVIFDEQSRIYPDTEENFHRGIPVCLVNGDGKLEKIKELLSTFKTLEKRCMENRVSEMTNEKEYKEKINKKILEYQKKIEEERVWAEKAEELVKNIVVSAPIKRVLK